MMVQMFNNRAHNNSLPNKWELANGLDPNSAVGDGGANNAPRPGRFHGSSGVSRGHRPARSRELLEAHLHCPELQRPERQGL